MTDILVEGQGTAGTLTVADLSLPCVLGRSGLSTDKREGDGATPIGRFPLRRVFYRADRLAAPVTALPVTALTPDDGWCDAPGDPRYNEHVKLPYAGRHEELWRTDELYDVVVVIGYNDAPIMAGKGSAIFMHVRATDGAPTAGCIALTKDDLFAVLAKITAVSTITIKPR